MIEDLGIHFNRSEKLFIDDLKSIFNETQMRIIQLKLDGYKNIEIATRLGCCPATITKYMAEIKTIIRKKVRNGSI